jgi:ketopantoate reductase
VHDLVSGVIDELLEIASLHHCKFPADFKAKTIEQMLVPTSDPSTMYQDFAARRPMEIETYLGAPLQMANNAGIKAPRIQTLYWATACSNQLRRTTPATPYERSRERSNEW